MSFIPLLSYLNHPLSSLEGTSPKVRGLLTRLVGRRVFDLLYHFPRQIQTRIYFSSMGALEEALFSRTSPVETLSDEFYATLSLTVTKILWPPRKGLPIRIHMSDGTKDLEVVYFSLSKSYLVQKFPIGKTLLISGKVSLYNKKVQMSHPDFVGDMSFQKEFEGNLPVYPLTTGLSNKIIAAVIQRALAHLQSFLPPHTHGSFEWIPPHRLAHTRWPSWQKALSLVHSPSSNSQLDPMSPARSRLSYDELLAHQLTLLLSRRQIQEQKGRSYIGQEDLIQTFTKTLPFTLTTCQEEAIKIINQDMAAPTPMVRLLQGDVGSGKTVVSFISALNCLTNQIQVAFMAPTEILARQHYETMSPWCASLGLRCEFLQGGMRHSKKGSQIKEELAKGSIHLIIGTHALLEEDILFKDLGLMIIDEQHRFGVSQRLALAKKGNYPDLLVTSATPIPRTLQLTQYGDMDISVLKSKPQGRKPIKTCLFPEGRLEEVASKLISLLEKDEKIYWICPLVEESEILDLTPAINRHKMLSALFPHTSVSLLHGQMNTLEKQKVMEAFSKKGAHILVATTVVEVGMDIRDATLMVIEHAERFGLSQLHQLRGRVGRNDLPAHCFLIYGDSLSLTARARLFALKQSEDGFLIAEEDLRLRGYGALLGTTQSGVASYKATDAYAHSSLFELAHKDALWILEQKDSFFPFGNPAILFLLSVFQCEEALTYLRAG